jgi:hypothetical protein
VAEPEALPAATAAAVVVAETLPFVVNGRLPTLSKEIILVKGAAVRESMAISRGAGQIQTVLATKVRHENVGGDGTGGMIAALSTRHNHAVVAVNPPQK